MDSYNLSKNHVIYEMAADNKPALHIVPPCRMRIETLDVFGNQTMTGASIAEIDRSRLHPATGPVYIENAEPGDALMVKILSIQVGNTATLGLVPKHGLIKSTRWATQQLPIQHSQLSFGRLRLPLKPMLGIIGVAPAARRIPCNWPGSHGGNLDTREITIGATVLLPVFVPGALLAVGDVHALQADGEVCGMAAEVPAVVELEIRVVKRPNFPIVCPWVFYGTQVIIIQSGRTIEEASQAAVKEMVAYLAGKYKISKTQAYCLCSLVADLRISQIVNPWVTVKVVVDLSDIGQI